MRLSELEPVWIRYRGRRAVGVRFQCPACRRVQICVLFLNCPDGAQSVPVDPDVPGNNRGQRWARSGLTFEDLTLTPSVDASRPDPEAEPDVVARYQIACTAGGEAHWHGFLTDGEIR